MTAATPATRGCRTSSTTSARSRAKDTLQLLLEFSEELPPLPARYAEHRDLLEQVPECQSPLFLAVEVEPTTAPRTCSSTRRRKHRPPGASRASCTTGLDGLSAQEVLAMPAEFTTQLGLSDLVSPLRLRGMAAMLARIKRQILEQQGAQSPAARAAGEH